MRRQVSIPSIRGMSTSRNTIAGCVPWATSSASTPSAASWSSNSDTSSSVVGDQLADELIVVDDQHGAAHRISLGDAHEGLVGDRR